MPQTSSTAWSAKKLTSNIVKDAEIDGESDGDRSDQNETIKKSLHASNLSKKNGLSQPGR